MSTKAVTDRQKSTDGVISTGEVHAQAIADAFAARYRGHLRKGESMPDVAMVVHLALRGLQASTAALVAADEAHEAELRDDAEPRKQRDAAAQALRTRLVEVRGALDGVYGPTTAREAGFAGDTPYDPVVMSRLARAVVKALSKLKLPKPRIAVGPLHLQQLADEIESLDDALNKHLKTVKREESEAAGTLLAKGRAMEEQNTDFVAAATVLEGLLIVAGKPELADRVRPPRRQGSGGSEDGGGVETKDGGGPEGEKKP